MKNSHSPIKIRICFFPKSRLNNDEIDKPIFLSAVPFTLKLYPHLQKQTFLYETAGASLGNTANLHSSDKYLS